MTLKKWEELDVLDNYLINAVASDPDVAEPFFRRLLSVLLQRKVGKIRVAAENFFPGSAPDRRGIRLDVEVDEYMTDGREEPVITNVYDLEPHLRSEEAFPKMMRFRQAKLDSKHMKSGDNNFDHMPDLYVILITNFDVFDRGCMVYTFKQTCREEPDLTYDDGLTILYFNTNGSRGGSRDIENVLKYLQDSRNVMAVDEATKELDGYVETVKGNAKLKGDYMTFGDLIDNMVEDGVKARQEEMAARVTEEVTQQVTQEVTLSTLRENILDILRDRWNVPEDLQNKLNEVSDPERLHALLLLAARSQSIEEFAQKMTE